ncbi:MAG: Hint domain-containing protein [Pseudomonadota bacterium]
MATNDNDTPATEGDSVFTGTSGGDTLSGGLGNDTINAGDGDDIIAGDGPVPGAWHYETYDYNFSSAAGQAFDIETGTRTASGYVTDFDVEGLTNTIRGTTGDQNDFGVIYTSTLNITAGGTYRFTTRSDDGSTIQLFDSAGNAVSFSNQTGGTLDYLNNDFHQPPTTRWGEAVLDPNETYTVQIRYWENAGGEAMSATITGPDTGGASQDLLTSPLLGLPPGPDYSVTGTPAGVEGNDILNGGTGDDTIYGNGGDDTITGGSGEDYVEGGDGDDQISDGPNLLTNGSLEAGVPDNTFSTSANPVGWTNDAGNIEGWGDGYLGNSTKDGGNFVELDNGSAADNLYQDVQTEAGEPYAITFDSAARAGSEGEAVEIYWNGVLVDTINPGSTDFLTYSYTVTGTGGMDRLEFREPASESNGLGPMLDNVSLTLASDDEFHGGAGNDAIDGGGGNDTLFGDEGDDTILGGAGDDTIDGGTDNDTITGGAGDDTSTGGEGFDTFIYTAGDDDDTITDFNTATGQDFNDGDQTNNDFVDLSAFYTDIFELRADQRDDGILNQSTGDFSDNTALGGSLTLTGVSDQDLTQDNTNVACFVAGSMIVTPDGVCPVEAIKVGDLVVTKDNGAQPVRWVGSRTVEAEGKLAPILFAPGAVGNTGAFLVSPQHRILVSSWQAEVTTGEQEVLVAAKHLVNGTTVIPCPCPDVAYHHIMFDQHELIKCAGIYSESFHPSASSLRGVDEASREEILTLFPELATSEKVADLPTSRRVLRKFEARLLAS